LYAIAQVWIEIGEWQDIYDEHRWNRAFLVPAGHVHSTTACSTCFVTTQFEWLTHYSGADETEIVSDAGELACTICYPTAPAEVLNRPTAIVSKSQAEKAAARAEREAKSAAKEAKRIAASVTGDGGFITIPSRWNDTRYEHIETEYAARREWNSAQDDLTYATYEWNAAPTRESNTPERQRIIEEALATKHGVTPEFMREELLKKYDKRK
jgi:hypothetical protein